MRPRRTELGLIVMALALAGAAYVLVSLGKTATVPANLTPFFLGVGGLLLGAHVTVRILAPRAHPIPLAVVALLNSIGYVMLARLNPDLARAQALWSAIGVGLFAATLFVVRDISRLARMRYTMMLLGMALLLLPLVPGLGKEVNGSRLWVELGPISFQPGEFAKIALAIFVAGYLAERRTLLASVSRRVGPLRLPDPRYLGPLLLAWGVSLIVLLTERDLGSSLLFFSLFVVTLWVATSRWSFLIGGLGLFSVGAAFAYNSFSHFHDRVRTWLNPWPEADKAGFQLTQAAFAFGSGGVAGSGLALGSPQRIPLVSTDFIFAAIGEELGLFGTTAILIAFVLLVAVGLHIATTGHDPFTQLLATALTFALGFQTFVILGGVTRLVPLTGITLPFVSYGGSSLLANYVLLALLLRMSDQTARTQ